MRFRPFMSLLVEAFDVGLELRLVDPPHASAPDLDGRKLAGANERVDLRNAHAQVGRDVLEREETRLDGRPVPAASRAGFRAHLAKIAPCKREFLDLTLFANV
jgi:hypothetical protein